MPYTGHCLESRNKFVKSTILNGARVEKRIVGHVIELLADRFSASNSPFAETKQRERERGETGENIQGR